MRARLSLPERFLVLNANKFTAKAFVTLMKAFDIARYDICIVAAC